MAAARKARLDYCGTRLAQYRLVRHEAKLGTFSSVLRSEYSYSHPLALRCEDMSSGSLAAELIGSRGPNPKSAAGLGPHKSPQISPRSPTALTN